MATLTNTTGIVQQNAGFTEIVTAGVVTPQNLPTAINQSFSYANGTSAGNVDLIYGKQLSLSGAITTVEFVAAADLSGTTQVFARIREFLVQNLSSFPLKIYASSASGVTWLAASSTAAILLPGYGTSATSTSYPSFRMCDPVTVGATSGMYVTASSSKIVFDPGANSFSINVIAAGCSASS